MTVQIYLQSKLKKIITSNQIELLFSDVLNELARDNFVVLYDGRRQQVAKPLIGVIKKGIKVGVALVDEGRMQQLNRDYHGVDRVTDVLSWGYAEETIDGVDEKEKWPSPEMDEDQIFGEIAVCYTQIEKNAMEHGVTVDEELRNMLKHSFFHLLGLHHG